MRRWSKEKPFCTSTHIWMEICVLYYWPINTKLHSRHKEDNRANSLEVSVVQGEATSVSKSMNIKVCLSQLFSIFSVETFWVNVNMDNSRLSNASIHSSNRLTLNQCHTIMSGSVISHVWYFEGGGHHPPEGRSRGSMRLHRSHIEPQPGFSFLHLQKNLSGCALVPKAKCISLLMYWSYFREFKDLRPLRHLWWLSFFL